MRNTLRLLALPTGPGQVRRAVLVLNRVGQPGGLTRAQIEEALGNDRSTSSSRTSRAWSRCGDPRHPGRGEIRLVPHGILELAREARLRPWPKAAAVKAERDDGSAAAGHARERRAAHFRPQAPRTAEARPPRPNGSAPASMAGNAAARPAAAPVSASDTLLAELRSAGLSQLDPAASRRLPAERLLPEIERLVAEIATERRIQLNSREQRQLANELVNDMLGLGPLEPLLEDESIADIMVNGPDRVFVERRGKVTLSREVPRRARMWRISASASPPRSAAASTRAARWWMPACRRPPRQYRVPAAGARRALRLDP